MRSKASATSLARPALHAAPDRETRGGLTTGGLTAAALGLQRTLGNRLTGRLLAGALVRPKLTINRPGDRYEQEADRVADQVMQRQPAEDEDETLQAKPATVRITPLVQRQTTPEEEEMALQRQSLTEDKEDEEELLQAKRTDAQVPTVTSSLAAAVDSAREGGGRRLDSATLEFVEPRFGRDFSDVRVHTGSRPASAAAAMKARAFTIGRDVAFGAWQYAPNTVAGRRLLAHELTHVVQQPRGRSTPAIQRSPWDVTRTQPDAASSDISLGTIPAPLTEQNPTSGAEAPAIVEIGKEDMMITSRHPKLVQFARAVRRNLEYREHNLPSEESDALPSEAFVPPLRLDPAAYGLDPAANQDYLRWYLPPHSRPEHKKVGAILREEFNKRLSRIARKWDVDPARLKQVVDSFLESAKSTAKGLLKEGIKKIAPGPKEEKGIHKDVGSLLKDSQELEKVSGGNKKKKGGGEKKKPVQRQSLAQVPTVTSSVEAAVQSVRQSGGGVSHAHPHRLLLGREVGLGKRIRKDEQGGSCEALNSGR